MELKGVNCTGWPLIPCQPLSILFSQNPVGDDLLISLGVVCLLWTTTIHCHATGGLENRDRGIRKPTADETAACWGLLIGTWLCSSWISRLRAASSLMCLPPWLETERRLWWRLGACRHTSSSAGPPWVAQPMPPTTRSRLRPCSPRAFHLPCSGSPPLWGLPRPWGGGCTGPPVRAGPWAVAQAQGPDSR